MKALTIALACVYCSGVAQDVLVKKNQGGDIYRRANGECYQKYNHYGKWQKNKCDCPFIISSGAFKNVVSYLGKRPDTLQIFGKWTLPYAVTNEGYKYIFDGYDGRIVSVKIIGFNEVPFQVNKLTSPEFLNPLGIIFPAACKSDTILIASSKGAFYSGMTMFLRGCTRVHPARYEDVSNFYFKMEFSSNVSDLGADLKMIEIWIEQSKKKWKGSSDSITLANPHDPWKLGRQ